MFSFCCSFCCCQRCGWWREKVAAGPRTRLLQSPKSSACRTWKNLGALWFCIFSACFMTLLDLEILGFFILHPSVCTWSKTPSHSTWPWKCRCGTVLTDALSWQATLPPEQKTPNLIVFQPYWFCWLICSVDRTPQSPHGTGRSWGMGAWII